MLLPLDPAPHGNDALRLRKIDGLLRFLEGSLGLLTDRGRIDDDVRRTHRRGVGPARCGIRAKRANLERHDVRGGARRLDVGAQLPLEDRTNIDVAVRLDANRGDVGHERTVKPRSQRRREIARLVRVREEDVRRLLLGNQPGQRGDVAVGRVLRKRLGHDDDHFGNVCGGDLGRTSIHRSAQHDDLQRSAGLLRGRNRLPARAVQSPVTLFGHHEPHD